MELRHLEQIVAVVEAKGFNGAARTLGVSQPTLSKSIARLEAELGIQLFERSAEGTRPTSHGEFLARRAEPLLHEVAKLRREIGQRSRGEVGQLTIAVGAVTHLKPLPMVMRHSAVEFPNLQLAVKRVRRSQLARGVQEGLYDISFTRKENAEGFPDLIRVKLFETDIIMAVRPGHPLLERAPVGPAAVLDYPMAHLQIDRSLLSWIGSMTNAQDAHLRALLTDEPELIRVYPFGTDRIARGPRFVFERDLVSGALVELRTTGHWPFECWMLTTRGLWSVPLVRKIAEFSKRRSL
ncbi:LysR family transcriptional regulator [Sphingomonas sp. MMSM20]|uniref:LysR family transcriptional regulator n=1 Tax=Sphingomonas lycopersici TaxID=2951807 RepID=UPI002238058E|nr:LysR family transcriptional regulator [Sphingomonas lycopersici]MCW6532478.1 LysR family transcriptional regulator [Sphingomonas lycopersici]